LEELGGWIKAYQQLRGASRLVVPGTGILDDYGTTPDGLPLQLLRWCAVARLRRIPVELLAVGAGPVEHPRSRAYMRWAAKLATKRSFRDTESREFVASLGINSRRDGVLPDLTFALPVLRREDAPPFRSRPLVALGAMAYFGWRGDPVAGKVVFEEYVERIIELSARILTAGMDVRLVMGESEDRRAVNAILAGFEKRYPSETMGRPEFLASASFADVAQQVRQADVLIASRFHNLVAAFTHGVPCISLSYSPKNDSLLRRVGVERYCLKIDTFRVDVVLSMLAEMMGLRQLISGRIAEQTLEWREELTRIGRQTEANPPVRGRDAGEGHS
jgi:polysaccharide pyruvyl transferase WcaK-like protein